MNAENYMKSMQKLIFNSKIWSNLIANIEKINKFKIMSIDKYKKLNYFNYHIF